MKNPIVRIVLLTIPLLAILTFAGWAMADEAGASMSKAEAKELIAKATSAQDHHRLAVYFTAKAANMEAEAVEHDELAVEYEKHPGVGARRDPMSAKSAGHCHYFAKVARQAAEQDRAMAAAHEGMARAAGK